MWGSYSTTPRQNTTSKSRLRPSSNAEHNNQKLKMSQPALTADYTSPASEPFKIAHTLPTISSTASTADKSSYLKALRASVADTQDTINKELTARMEQDKARDAAAEAKEEENYGEEVQEEED